MAKGTLNITSDGIGSADITDGSIAAADMAADSITTKNILDSTIVSLTCGTTNTNTTVTAASTTGMIVGAAVSGAGIPASATVVSIITNTSFVLSVAATATASVTLTFDSGITSKKLAQNLTLTGDYVTIPTATTTQRDALTAVVGMLVYNSTLGLTQQYTAVGWKSIDAPPVVSSISPTTQAGYTADVVVTGSNFSTGFTAKFIGADGSQYTPASTVFTNASTLTLRTPSTGLPASKEPYDIQVTNASGLAGTLAAALDAGGIPAFTTAAGTLGSVWDSARTNPTLSTAVAVDPDGNAITAYAVSVGALPGGLSLNTSTAAITGTASAVGSNTTTNFTISATTANGDVATRAFSITINAPVVTNYIYTGSDQVWTTPAGVTGFVVKCWGAGGGVGTASPDNGAQGGGGGYSIGAKTGNTPGTQYTIVVGAGGTALSTDDGTSGSGGNGLNYGGGGSVHGNNASATAGRGGGLAGVFTGNGTVFSGGVVQSGAHGRAMIIAGGAGAGCYSNEYGGGGGGTTGGDGEVGSPVANQGLGGTQSAGGGISDPASAPCPGEVGGALYGGYGGNQNCGGAGAGYYGGGGGTCGGPDGAGGGGSGYIGGVSSALGVTAATTNSSQGSRSANNTGDSDYINGSASGYHVHGYGARPNSNNHGGHAFLVIKY